MNTAIKLRKIASMLKNTLSSAERLSVLYILKLAGYEDEWRKEIENLAKNAPKHFESVFQGRNRIYLPFGRKTILSEQDQDVLDFLHSKNFNVPTNDMYIDGYAESKQYPGRLVRIGKIFDDLKKEQEILLNDIVGLRADLSYIPKTKNQIFQALFKKYKEYEETDFNMALIEGDTKKYLLKLSALSENFRTSPARQKKDVKDYQIVISQDPHDVAKMSYERSWKSCRTLKSESDESEDYGSYCSSTLDDVRSGGMVAYLIEASDIDIKNPIARIAIRKFEDNDGNISARMESTVYGINIEGFKDAVRQFLDKNLPKPKAGYATMLGGRQTDTFDMVLRGRDRGFIFVENIEDLNNTITKELKSLYESEPLQMEISNALSKHIIKRSKNNAMLDIAIMFNPNINREDRLKRYYTSIQSAAEYWIDSRLPRVINVINRASSLSWTKEEVEAHKKIVLMDSIVDMMIKMHVIDSDTAFTQDVHRLFQAIGNETLWSFLNVPSSNRPPKNPERIIKAFDEAWSKVASFPIENFFDKFVQIQSEIKEQRERYQEQYGEIIKDILETFSKPSESLANYIIMSSGIYATDCLSIIEQIMPEMDQGSYYPRMKKFMDEKARSTSDLDGQREIMAILEKYNFPTDQVPAAAKDVLNILKPTFRMTQAPSLLAAREFIKYQSEGFQEPLQEPLQER